MEREGEPDQWGGKDIVLEGVFLNNYLWLYYSLKHPE